MSLNCGQQTYCSSPRWYMSMEPWWNDTDRGKPKTEKSVPVPLCPQQILHGSTRARTQASAVLGRPLTIWAMARPGKFDTQLHRVEKAGVAQSVQCLDTGWTTGRSRFDPRLGQRIFPLTSVSRPTLGPTQPPVQWVPGVLSPGVKRGRGVMSTTHPHLVPRSRMSTSYNSSPPKRLHGV
jgi:hypothetical protein